ncbi:MAG TPA: TrkH family potassium uptake protein [Trueperaceae bacterium]|nr:TrkH family potassium uptake protein [Trueperaceae bacterium]
MTTTARTQPQRTRRDTSRGKFFPYVLGTGFMALSFAATAFAIYALAVGEPFHGFAATVLVALPAGLYLRRLGSPDADPSRREALITVLLSWLFLPALGAIPYVFGGQLPPLDAFFESMSGFTTTGATTIQDFSLVPDSLLLWRAVSQWVGGVGILVLFLAVFPQLAIAGRQMFHAEMPGPSQERFTPRLRQTALAVVALYAALTIACAAAYAVAGMAPFDALAHAFGTLAAGGFSANAASFADYSAPALQWIAILFMTLSGASFILVFRAVSGQPRALLRDAEFRVYIGILVVGGGILAMLLAGEYGTADAIRHGLFQSVSIVTSTGFASADFREWGLPAQGVILALLFVGGCGGSASGGVKVVRWLIIAKHTAREVRHAIHPRAVLPVRVGDRIVSEDAIRAVGAFITLYVGLFAFTTIALVFLGADFTSAFSASIASLGNTGPGLGPYAPIGQLDELSAVGKLLLMFAMYAGRLEVVTVFVIFTPGWWRLPRVWSRG